MGIKIAVDAGHGSLTAGKRSAPVKKNIDFEKDGKIDVKKAGQIREHIAAVGVSNFLVKELIHCGFEVVKTGWNDKNALNDSDTALRDRQHLIAAADCDYSVSIHFNAYGDGKTFNAAQGIGVYIHTEYSNSSRKLADSVLKNLIKGSKQINRGITKANFAMCNCNAMNTKGSILIELCFMTNKHEAQELMGNSDYWKESAKEIAHGICEYTGIKYV